MNMMFSDYEDLPTTFNVAVQEIPKFFACMARKFLFDDDTTSLKWNSYFKWCSRKG